MTTRIPTARSVPLVRPGAPGRLDVLRTRVARRLTLHHHKKEKLTKVTIGIDSHQYEKLRQIAQLYGRSAYGRGYAEAIRVGIDAIIECHPEVQP